MNRLKPRDSPTAAEPSWCRRVCMSIRGTWERSLRAHFSTELTDGLPTPEEGKPIPDDARSARALATDF
jgi:hypothetical protein